MDVDKVWNENVLRLIGRKIRLWLRLQEEDLQSQQKEELYITTKRTVKDPSND